MTLSLNIVFKILVAIISLQVLWGAYFPALAQNDSRDSGRREVIILSPVELKEISVTGKKNSPQQGAPSTEKVLEQMEGVSLIKRGNYAKEPVYRGMSGERLGVTIDGMKIFGGCTDKMDPATSYIEPNNLSKANLMNDNRKGSTGGFTAGGLDFQLKKPGFSLSPKMRAGILSSYSSASNGFDQLGEFEFNTGKFAIRLNGAYRKHNDYIAGGSRGRVPFSGFEKNNLGIFAKYLLNNSTTLSFDLIRDRAINVGYPSLPMDVAYAKADIASIGVKHYFRSSKFRSVESRVYMNAIRHAMDDSRRPDILMRMDMPGASRTAGAFLQTEIRPLAKMDILLKAEGWTHFSRAEMTMYPEGEKTMFLLTWPDVNRRGTSFFCGIKYPLTKKTSFSGGGRVEWASARVNSPLGLRQFSVFGFDASQPREFLLKGINGKLKTGITKRTEVFISVSYSERIPEVSELFGYYIFNAFDGYNYAGNPGIRKERATEISVGANFSGEKISCRAEAFYNRLNDFILGKVDPSIPAMTPGAKGVKVFDNISYATFYGGEARVEVHPVKGMDIFTGISYVRASDQENNPLPLIPPLTFRSGMRCKRDKFLFNLNSEVTTSQNRISVATGETATPGYLIFNSSAGYNTVLYSNSLQLSLAVENIFNTHYYSHLDWGKIPRTGRNLILSIKYSLEKQIKR